MKRRNIILPSLLVLVLAFAIILSGCSWSKDSDTSAINDPIMNEVSTDKAPAAIGPYSQAIDMVNVVFTSGVIPVDPTTGSIPEGIEAQAELAFTNLKNLIEASGTTMDKVIKTTIYIKDMNEFSTINKVYEKYFSEPYPARSCVEVSRLPKDVSIEVEAIVAK